MCEPLLPPSELRGDAADGERSAVVRERVQSARARQQQRAGKANAHLDQAETLRDCALCSADHDLLEQAMERLQLSARSMHRILRVARTIADLAGEERIARVHLTEAIGYRQLDRGVVGVRGEFFWVCCEELTPPRPSPLLRKREGEKLLPLRAQPVGEVGRGWGFEVFRVCCEELPLPGPPGPTA